MKCQCKRVSELKITGYESSCIWTHTVDFREKIENDFLASVDV